ncbi:putative small heat shock protein/30kD HSP [Blumeria hordei DH14]|uniref:Putative small heat shock protein/30kD HSP n=1 Tax=Blumeria graminis f. sp. hordei (strain DH14) TaxID=546991 RepID=N1J4U2_BLUG1|nr:putative small heat shock protein/30kD HSP [Blumeria hordei DH14]
MSLFPRAFFHQDQSSSPTIFRLLDEFDQYSRGMDRIRIKSQKLPGIDQKNVDIEFTDASTLTIKGRIERSYSKGTPPAALVEGEADKAAICEDGNSRTTKQDNVAVKKSEDSNTSLEKFWVMERSIGEFSRSFAFPVPVNQENVKASMKDGIMSVMIPKAKKQENRKISIQ